jgi:hypothetical protein
VRGFTEATRAEPGNLCFDWSRSVDDPSEFVLVGAFTDDGAGPHVDSDHFKAAMQAKPQGLDAAERQPPGRRHGVGHDGGARHRLSRRSAARWRRSTPLMRVLLADGAGYIGSRGGRRGRGT